MIPMALMAPPQGAEGGNPLAPLLMMGLIMVIFYFLLLRPQQSQQKKHQLMIKGIKKGDRILTNGGIYGKVVGVHENMLVVQIAKDVNIELQRSAVAGVTGETGGNGKE